MTNTELVTLNIEHLDSILKIEQQVYSFPWSRGNFVDSFNAEHVFFGIVDESKKLLAYIVLMPVLDEVHLLTIAVALEQQQRGFALILLNKMCEYAVEQHFLSVMLEVRIGNVRAIEVYDKFGFEKIGLRKKYYASFDQTREDALVMRKMLYK